MKKIYSFSVNKDNFVDGIVTKIDAEQKESKVVERINKPTTKTYFIAKPSFTLKQESNLYYESVVAECIKKGIYTSIQLRKRFIDDGGILSLQEKKNYENLWSDLWLKKSELNQLNEKPEENKESIIVTNEKILKILSDLQTIEEKSGNNLLYEHTAEKIASDRTVLWLTLNLAYEDLGGDKQSPFFGKGSFDEKLKKYEEIEMDEDADEYELTQKLFLVASLWYYNKAGTTEEFDKIMAMAESKSVLKK